MFNDAFGESFFHRDSSHLSYDVQNLAYNICSPLSFLSFVISALTVIESNEDFPLQRSVLSYNTMNEHSLENFQFDISL